MIQPGLLTYQVAKAHTSNSKSGWQEGKPGWLMEGQGRTGLPSLFYIIKGGSTNDTELHLLFYDQVPFPHENGCHFKPSRRL